jgi:hypothetical protein
MRSLLLILGDIHSCLKIICEIESDVLDSSLFGLFRKKDFSSNEQKLLIVKEKLETLASELAQYKSNKQIAMTITLDAAYYLKALYETGASLSILNANLQDKSSGGKYSLIEYNEDLSIFRKCQENYLKAGDVLNAKYRLYTSELI